MIEVLARNLTFCDLLLKNNLGQFFHIDFGFILGKDPKVLPPPLKLCSEMVEGTLFLLIYYDFYSKFYYFLLIFFDFY